MGTVSTHTLKYIYRSSMEKSWIYQGAIFFLVLLVETVSGREPGSSSTSVQISTLGSQLSTLGTQLIQLQQQVDVLQQENMEYKERIVHLEEVTEDLEGRISRLESQCGSTERETEKLGFLMAIGGFDENYIKLRSAEVLNASCDIPLPESRAGHMSVTTVDGKTLVCGGSTSSGRTASCLQFDHQSKSWKEHSQLLTKHRFYASTVTLSGGTYVLGGQDETSDAVSSSEFLATGSSVHGPGSSYPWYRCEGV